MKLQDFIPKSLMSDEQDAVAMLTADHDKVKDLFAEFEEIKDTRANRQKEKIVTEACRELTVHTKLEEEIFYPALRKAIDEDDLMNEAKVEHDSAKQLIRQLESMQATDGMFVAKFTVLAEYVKHHIEEEQNEMFPLARKSELDLEALGRKMMKRKEQLMGAVRPAGRSAPAKRKTSGARAPASSAR